MRRLSAAILLGAAIASGAIVAPAYLDAVGFIARAAALGGSAGRVAVWRATPTLVEPVQQIPTRYGPIEARVYRPAGGAVRRAVTLVPGVHMDGIRETRLVGMAEDLAASGFTVLTVATPDLQRFRITPESTDMIEDAAIWLAREYGPRTPSGRDGKIGMLGISFSGGLSIVAAGRPALRDHVSFVMSFGGHGDLPRVMRYVASGNAPETPTLGPGASEVPGADQMHIKPAHDYAAAVVLLSLADRIVPADQVEPLRQGILIFLTASSLTLVDMTRAEAEFARAREYVHALPDPARTLMQHVNDRAVDKLGPVLLPVVDQLSGTNEASALSPERAPSPRAPVFLLHGAEDNVIPSSETVLLAMHLRQESATVHALLSGLVTHAEVDRPPTMAEMWRLVRFWEDLLTR
ncbi:MAG: alpha/beta hydrolase family protein [Acidobacteriota bacterium]